MRPISAARRPTTLAATALLGAIGAGVSWSQAPAPSPAPPAEPPPVAAAPAAPATPAVPAPPAPPPGPDRGIRNKVAAGDLLSAESILEEHRVEKGEDSAWVNGLGWLARGALLLGDLDKAARYAAQTRSRCADAVARGAKLEEDHPLEIALGAAIEVEAQLVERKAGARKAAEQLRKELSGLSGPVALRSRIQKRINILTLAGTPAPALVAEDFLGDPPPSLAALRGKPIVLFLFAEWCGDCKAQQRALAAAWKRRAGDGTALIALTRYYDEEAKRSAEKDRVAVVWKTSYPDVGAVPIVISTASMERYGGSSTPSFVFIDRAGIVRGYAPTRLTEAELDARLQALAR
ncbi:MAG TPA: TlpA disulfide reductase family protein [Candidatus Polarisedimenticolia bacterium]|nr:TlpA disulfide reductase family protein [Candidatus Polarisedimenticolia bacterium]